MSLKRCLTFLMIVTSSILAAHTASAEDITFETTDGVTVHATFEGAAGGTYAPYIILFHQAGSNGRAEYETISDRLVAEGYHVLMVDQRSGGDRFGGTNRTAAAFDQDPGYCAAYPDLIAATEYVKASEHKGPIFVWGSSYSAGLVINLAAEYFEGIAGALAFSPASGGPMAACSPDQNIAKARMPIFALRPESEIDRPRVQYQLDLLTASGHQVYVAKRGVHGSSMLDRERNGYSTRATWSLVLDFLDQTAMDWTRFKKEQDEQRVDPEQP